MIDYQQGAKQQKKPSKTKLIFPKNVEGQKSHEGKNLLCHSLLPGFFQSFVYFTTHTAKILFF